MPKTKYVARHNDKIIGTRSSDRVYTHAVAVVYSEAKARSEAYDRMPNATDRKNFDHLVIEAAGKSPYDFCRTPEAIAKAQTRIDGGFDAYVERLRQAAITSFEKRKADGAFEPGIVTWCGRPDLAMKEANKYRASANITHVAIIEAEKV